MHNNLYPCCFSTAHPVRPGLVCASAGTANHVRRSGHQAFQCHGLSWAPSSDSLPCSTSSAGTTCTCKHATILITLHSHPDLCGAKEQIITQDLPKLSLLNNLGVHKKQRTKLRMIAAPWHSLPSFNKHSFSASSNGNSLLDAGHPPSATDPSLLFLGPKNSGLLQEPPGHVPAEPALGQRQRPVACSAAGGGNAKDPPPLMGNSMPQCRLLPGLGPCLHHPCHKQALHISVTPRCLPKTCSSPLIHCKRTSLNSPKKFHQRCSIAEMQMLADKHQICFVFDPLHMQMSKQVNAEDLICIELHNLLGTATC